MKKTEIETRSENDIMGIFLHLLSLSLCVCVWLHIKEMKNKRFAGKKCEKNFHLPCYFFDSLPNDVSRSVLVGGGEEGGLFQLNHAFHVGISNTLILSIHK